jgi:hypothetical protein
MGTASAEDYAPVAAAWDFSRAKVVADLGGGGGSLILAVLGLNPHLRGMLVDFESSVDAAKSHFKAEDPFSRSTRTSRTHRGNHYRFASFLPMETCS